MSAKREIERAVKEGGGTARGAAEVLGLQPRQVLREMDREGVRKRSRGRPFKPIVEVDHAWEREAVEVAVGYPAVGPVTFAVSIKMPRARWRILGARITKAGAVVLSRGMLLTIRQGVGRAWGRSEQKKTPAEVAIVRQPKSTALTIRVLRWV